VGEIVATRETPAQLDAAEVDHLHPKEPEARVMKTREGHGGPSDVVQLFGRHSGEQSGEHDRQVGSK
jgi:hypothetical protein